MDPNTAMEAIVLLVIVVIVLLIVLPIVAIIRASQLSGRVAEMEDRVAALHARIANQEREARHAAATAPKVAEAKASAHPGVVPEVASPPARSPWPGDAFTAPPPVLPPISTAAVEPPDLMVASGTAPAPELPPVFAASTESLPRVAPRLAPRPPEPPEPAFNWEQFLGIKGFAWIGGFALFLGVVFFVKYSFDHGWITPPMRVALGFLTGIGCMLGGAWLQRRQLSIPAQAVCAAGTVILYATTYTARSMYGLLGTGSAFGIMALVTAAAFALAVRFDAKVIAILGVCGGFLTPILVSTGQDNPLGLFTYVALLDVGLLAIAWRQGWRFLSPLGALGTTLLQLGWLGRFFVEGRYAEGNKILIPFVVFLGFCALFFAVFALHQRRHQDEEEPDGWFLWPALGLPVLALAVAFFFGSFAAVAERPLLLFGYVLLADAFLLGLPWFAPRFGIAQALGGAMAFALLAVWTGAHATLELLNFGLALYLVFGALHTLAPLLLERKHPELRLSAWSNAWALLALGLMLLPIFKLAPGSLAIWVFVLLLNLLVILLAAITGVLLWLVAAIGLTIAAAAAWILVAPVELDRLNGDLLVIALFAALFIAAGLWLWRRLDGKTDSVLPSGWQAGNLGALGNNQFLLPRVPALAAVMPFFLLVLVTLRLPLVNPSPVFGLALLLAVLLLGLARYFRLTALPWVAMLAVLALEHCWFFGRFTEPMATLAVAWFAGFTLLFTAFPFVFWREFKEDVLPWTASALAGPLHFYLVHALVKRAWPNDHMGLLPAIFALPALAGLWFLVKRFAPDDPKRNAVLALFGGAALFFITLIFPLQFSRQWLTLSWALEGVALLWLFHRVPHPGLRLTGVALLITSFVRLANPIVLSYHQRAETPILNWYLYTYAVVTLCLFAGAWLLAPPRERVFGFKVPPLLCALGTVLAFLLVNIEIADYFTPPGTRSLVFDFSGNFGRDMTYTIAWALFALVLVVIGIARQVRASRWAGMALLAVTLLKLFLHDLSSLGQLYRIGAFMVVAVIAIAASFLYQRFFAAARREATPTPPPPATP